jgi:hypothetical protein
MENGLSSAEMGKKRTIRKESDIMRAQTMTTAGETVSSEELSFNFESRATDPVYFQN